MTNDEQSQKGKTSYGSVAIDLTMLTVLAGALLYASGFLRIVYFMNHFQASMFILDIPLELYFLNGLSVFLDYWKLTTPLMLISILVVLPWGAYASAKLSFWVAKTSLVSAIALVGVMVAMAKPAAITDYESQKACDFAEYHPRVLVWLKPTSTNGSALAGLSASLSEGCCRLLLQTETMLYLFGHPPDKGKEPSVIAIPSDKVIALRALPRDEIKQCLDQQLSEEATKGDA